MDATKKRAAKLEAKGKPVDFKELLEAEPDGGTTNIRNEKSKHWTRWLGTRTACVVPFKSFQRIQQGRARSIWLARDEARAPCLLRRYLDQLDLRSEGQGRRNYERHLCVPDNGAER
jgi:putative SOS response-associated peptidase YedK